MSLFLQVFCIGSCLLLSPLLVDGISRKKKKHLRQFKGTLNSDCCHKQARGLVRKSQNSKVVQNTHLEYRRCWSWSSAPFVKRLSHSWLRKIPAWVLGKTLASSQDEPIVWTNGMGSQFPQSQGKQPRTCKSSDLQNYPNGSIASKSQVHSWLARHSKHIGHTRVGTCSVLRSLSNAMHIHIALSS